MADPLTPEQRQLVAELAKNGRGAVLLTILDNYRAGRRVACWFVHMFIGLGMAGGAVYGIWQGVSALLSMKAGTWIPR